MVQGEAGGRGESTRPAPVAPDRRAMLAGGVGAALLGGIGWRSGGPVTLTWPILGFAGAYCTVVLATSFHELRAGARPDTRVDAGLRVVLALLFAGWLFVFVRLVTDLGGSRPPAILTAAFALPCSVRIFLTEARPSSVDEVHRRADGPHWHAVVGLAPGHSR